MGVFRRNENWWIDYYVEGRRKREKIAPSKRLAETVLHKRRVEIAEGKYLDVRKKPEVNFDEAVERYMEWARANKISWKRDQQSLAHWQEEFKGKALSQVCKLDIERYKARRKEEVAPRTVNEELACLKRLFNRMMEWGLAEGNPVRGIKFLRQPPGRLKMLTPDEEGRLIDECCSTVKPVVITALHTGMRFGEIMNFEWKDIDFHHGIVTVRNSKNGESRQIPMNETLRTTIANLPRASDRVFISMKGKPYRSTRSAFENAVRRAGLQDFHFHDLRHCFASKLRMRGADLFLIKELLGQKSLEMTMRYAHITSERKQDVMKLLDGEFLESWAERGGSIEVTKSSVIA